MCRSDQWELLISAASVFWLNPFLAALLGPWTHAGLFCPCWWCVFREQLSPRRLCLCLQGSLIGRPAGVKRASSWALLPCRDLPGLSSSSADLVSSKRAHWALALFFGRILVVKTPSLAAYPEILEKIFTAPGSIHHARNVSEWGFPLKSEYAMACICHLLLTYLSRGRHISCTWLLTGADNVGINIRMCGSLSPGSSSSFWGVHSEVTQ